MPAIAAVTLEWSMYCLAIATLRCLVIRPPALVVDVCVFARQHCILRECWGCLGETVFGQQKQGAPGSSRNYWKITEISKYGVQ